MGNRPKSQESSGSYSERVKSAKIGNSRWNLSDATIGELKGTTMRVRATRSLKGHNAHRNRMEMGGVEQRRRKLSK